MHYVYNLFRLFSKNMDNKSIQISSFQISDYELISLLKGKQRQIKYGILISYLFQAQNHI